MTMGKESGIPAAAGEATGVWRRHGWWWEAFLQRTEETAALLEEVVGAMEALGYSSQEIWGVLLALEEAIANALKHGNGGDPTKRVRLRCYVGPAVLVAEVEDQGPGFNPAGVPDPTLPETLELNGGRGLLLMRHFMTWVHYSERGNHVTLFKCRSARKRRDSAGRI